MEFVDGEDLASLLRRIGRLPVEKAISVAREICAGLAAAHDKGVVHRDLKPANVMIDGAGHARLTDFGLAAYLHETHGDAHSGTPAYMAPEQLDGAPASIRTDLYALGVMLYELFSGARPFEARTILELKEWQRSQRPRSLTSSVRDLPAPVDDVIRQCLALDPNDRPPSVHAVRGAFPGGDALQLALDAGQTPTPAMVAAAGTVGRLGPAVAWSTLAFALLAMLWISWAQQSSTLVGRLEAPAAPEVLRAKARDIAVRLGFSDRPGDAASWFEWQASFERAANAHALQPGQWRELAASRPGPLVFVYRQSTNAMRSAVTQDAGYDFVPGRVSRDNPPLDTPGMVRVILDPQGRLLAFDAVPGSDRTGLAAGAPEWQILLDATGVDPRLRQAPATDAQAGVETTWVAQLPGPAQGPMHFHASHQPGSRLHFSATWPWVDPGVADDAESVGQLEQGTHRWLVRLIFASLAIVMLALLGALVSMIRNNLRLKRGDARGALRLAIASYLLVLVALSLPMHLNIVIGLFGTIGLLHALAAAEALLVGALYFALEPYARRRWPRALISWSRLLAGRVTDPMVGRDVLVGAAVGTAVAASFHLGVLVAPTDSAIPLVAKAGILSAPLDQFAWISARLEAAVSVVLSLMLLRTALGGGARWLQWLSYPLLVLVSVVVFDSSVVDAARWPSVLAAVAVFVLLARIGVLSCMACVFFATVLIGTPPSLDFGGWLGGSTAVTLAILALLLSGAFKIALGGHRAFAATWVRHD